MDLEASLKELDPASAARLERLVRDAIALAQPAKADSAEVDSNGWPIGYWEKYAGCLAGEQWDLPVDRPPTPNPKW